MKAPAFAALRPNAFQFRVLERNSKCIMQRNEMTASHVNIDRILDALWSRIADRALYSPGLFILSCRRVSVQKRRPSISGKKVFYYSFFFGNEKLGQESTTIHCPQRCPNRVKKCLYPKYKESSEFHFSLSRNILKD